MKRKLNSTNRRFSHWITKKLGESNKINRSSKESNKNIHSNKLLKKLDQKRYGLFRILKDIGQGTFQLELLEGWMIYNVFNEDLLTQCKKLQFKSQHMELAPLLSGVQYEVYI